MHINIARKFILDRILERKRKDEFSPEPIDLKDMLKKILLWANRFVPSESGSILLDDPILNEHRKKSGRLYFVSCFGAGSKAIVETSLPVNVGIVGKTYTTGKPYISKKAQKDNLFYSGIDKKTKFRTRSIICAPVKIKGNTIGVIELINRKDGADYNKDDLTLLKLFAEYTSTLVQNSLDAKRFGELSVRDNLTGLYNDRYFYDRLTREISVAVRDGTDLSLIFFDLDRFKEVNDTHGHLAGSRVLTEVGILLTELLSKGENDGIAARYGGDEFVVILPGSSLDDATAFSERLRITIRDFSFVRRRVPGIGKALKIRGQITSSVGVASLRENVRCTGTPDELRDALIKQADTAMYSSKQEGRDRTTVASTRARPTHIAK